MFLQAMRIFPKIIKIKLFSQGVWYAKNILCKTVLKEYRAKRISFLGRHLHKNVRFLLKDAKVFLP